MSTLRSRLGTRSGAAAFAAALLFVLPTTAAAQDEAEVVFVDGYVDIRLESGATYPADFGELLQTGDSVITEDGSAELDLETGGTVRVAPQTVFTLRSITDPEGATQRILSTSIGRIAFRFQRLVGSREPAVGTTAAVAGVRGTEIEVYAGVDGSSLFLVQSGEIAVESAGTTVVIGADTGVEVQPNQPPGEPFDALERAISFEEWNAGRLEAFLANPAASVADLGGRMDAYIEQIAALEPLVAQAREQLESERAKLDTIEEKEGREARTTHYEQVVVPLQIEAQRLYVNLRFYARSALSLRRFVLGRLNLIMMANYWDRPDGTEFVEFVNAYEQVLARYEQSVVPHLEPFDI